MNSKNNYLIVVCGPTASGKTSLGIRLAHEFNSFVISADSRQFYKEMNIGTAKPTLEEQKSAKHYFIDNISIFEPYSVGDYERDVIKFLNKKFDETNIAVMVGGSGLFLKAVCSGLDIFPNIPPEVRLELTKLFNKNGIVYLQKELKKLDPDYHNEVDLNNHRRLMRALEVCLASKRPYSSFLTSKACRRSFKIIKIGIEWERSQLHKRISRRIAIMEQDGLLDEVKKLYPFRELNSLKTIGYSELFKYLRGEISYEAAIENLKTNTRRYAKRQMTWLRKDKEIIWFQSCERNRVIEYIKNELNSDLHTFNLLP